MCIAIFAKPGVKVSDEELFTSYKANKDGCGFAYISTDYLGYKKIKIVKTMSYEVFLRKYHRAQANNPESPFVIHFRIATHGTVDTFNCHPFKINKNTVMMHNGIIPGLPIDGKRSDTQMFNDLILKDLPKDFYKFYSYELLIEKFIGASKLVVMDIEGNFTIYNEKAGHWKDDVWYSNTSYKSYVSYASKPGRVVTRQISYIKPKQQHDYYMCDKCKDYFASWACHFYKTFAEGFVKCFCTECNKEVKAKGIVTETMGISKYRYDVEMDMEDYYDSCGSYV